MCPWPVLGMLGPVDVERRKAESTAPRLWQESREGSRGTACPSPGSPWLWGWRYLSGQRQGLRAGWRECGTRAAVRGRCSQRGRWRGPRRSWGGGLAQHSGLLVTVGPSGGAGVQRAMRLGAAGREEAWQDEERCCWSSRTELVHAAARGLRCLPLLPVEVPPTPPPGSCPPRPTGEPEGLGSPCSPGEGLGGPAGRRLPMGPQGWDQPRPPSTTEGLWLCDLR